MKIIQQILKKHLSNLLYTLKLTINVKHIKLKIKDLILIKKSSLDLKSFILKILPLFTFVTLASVLRGSFDWDAFCAYYGLNKIFFNVVFYFLLIYPLRRAILRIFVWYNSNKSFCRQDRKIYVIKDPNNTEGYGYLDPETKKPREVSFQPYAGNLANAMEGYDSFYKLPILHNKFLSEFINYKNINAHLDFKQIISELRKLK